MSLNDTFAGQNDMFIVQPIFFIPPQERKDFLSLINEGSYGGSCSLNYHSGLH